MSKRKINTDIVLTNTELKIKDILVQFCTQYNLTVPEDKQLELRITGGWVRDKLLGDDSNDLDIAVNVLSGQEFALSLLKWAENNGMTLGQNASNLHTIKKNPEKSKHLETCTTKIFGLDIDFVNLRNEEYSDDSRVPIIECGTAEEDALRRDATLNALFYNINEEKIEDFTKRGLSDLQAGVLRTPLPPLQTFLDDPLRVLRLIRFASRFNFTIEDDTFSAMKDEKIKSALMTKISRERIGVELHKILIGSNTPYGLSLLLQVNILDIVFSVGTLESAVLQNNSPEIINEFETGTQLLPRVTEELVQLFEGFQAACLQSTKMRAVLDDVFQNKLFQKLFWLSACLRSYGDLKVCHKPNKASSVCELIIKEGLRFGKLEYESVSKIVTKMASSTLLARFFNNPQDISRSELGIYIREFDNYFAVNVLVNAFEKYIMEKESDGGSQVMAAFENFLETVVTENLEQVTQLKPLIDGKSISKALNRKPGPWMSQITPEVIRWQLDHPEGTATECLDHLKEYVK